MTTWAPRKTTPTRRTIPRGGSVVHGIDNKFVIVRLYKLSVLVDLHLLGRVVNFVALILPGFVLLR